MSSEADPLSAARRAIDRRRRQERRFARRARRQRTRVAWAIACLLGLNLAAWFSLETSSDLLTWTYMLKVDKLQHVAVFFAAMAVCVALLGRWVSAGVLAILLINAGLLIEMVQAFDPTRTADVADFAFDQIGVALGWLASGRIRRWLHQNGTDRSASLGG